MKYEFKPFYLNTYEEDLKEGWLPTYRISQEYPANIRGVDVFNLGMWAKPQDQVASVDHHDGSVHTHSLDGQFDRTQKGTLLDLILYREVKKPADRTVQGMAYVDAAGEIVSLRCMEDSTEKVATSLTPVPCTITLHSEPT